MNTIDLAGVRWRKSRRSNGSGNCVEAAAVRDGRRIAVRDSKNPSGPPLVVGPGAWRSLTGRIKAGQLG